MKLVREEGEGTITSIDSQDGLKAGDIRQIHFVNEGRLYSFCCCRSRGW